MKLSEIADLINKIEAKFPVDEWAVDGIHVWPWIRIRLSTDLINFNKFAFIKFNDNKVKKIIGITLGELKGISRYIYSYLKDYKKNSKIDYSVDVVLLSDGVSYTKLVGHWYEKNCDPFITYLNSNNIKTLLLSPLQTYHIPRYSPSVFIQPRLTFAMLKALLKSYVKRNKSINYNLPGYEECVSYLQSNEVPILLPSIESIKKNVVQLKEITGYYKKILIRTKPKFAFQVSYYGINGFAFNLACRELNITSMDIQHGAQGDHHRAYGRWQKVPPNGYELLPTLFWCWQDSEANAINSWSRHITPWHQAMAGGNLFLKLWIKGDKEFIQYYDDLINKNKSYNSTAQILVTLQGIETKDDLLRLINLINKTSPNYFWWLRCHPCRLKQKNEIGNLIASYNIPNSRIDEATDLPLYAILRHMDIHITMYSSVVIEADEFNVPSILTNQYGCELYPEQIISGWALPAYTFDEIVRAIEYQLNKRDSLIKAKKDKASLNSIRVLEELIHQMGY